VKKEEAHMLTLVELLGAGLIVFVLIAVRRAVNPADVKSLIGETFLTAVGGAPNDLEH
jgi:hypothetical protein